MDTKQIGLFIAVAGAVLTVYEFILSFCGFHSSGSCYFPFSPSIYGVPIPWYSVAVLVFGLLVYFSDSG